MKDLLLLCADADMKAVLEAVIKRLIERRRIAGISYDIKIAYRRDPEVYKKAYEIVRSKSHECKKCLVLFDYEGSGATSPVASVECEVARKIIANSDWSKEDVEVIVIEPELEIWIWKGWNHFYEVTEKSHSEVCQWVRNKNISESSFKPLAPKNLFEKFCRYFNVKKSAANYKKISEKASLENCKDRAFNNLINTLTNWFPP